jgi:hypothetical protein
VNHGYIEMGVSLVLIGVTLLIWTFTNPPAKKIGRHRAGVGKNSDR